MSKQNFAKFNFFCYTYKLHLKGKYSVNYKFVSVSINYKFVSKLHLQNESLYLNSFNLFLLLLYLEISLK